MPIPEFFDDEDAFLEPVSKALTEIFEKFDHDKDGLLNEKELQQFVMATNGQKLDERSLQEIRENFHVDDQNRLTKRGFLEMYQLQTLSEPEETWKDLQKHGYDLTFTCQESSE